MGDQLSDSHLWLLLLLLLLLLTISILKNPIQKLTSQDEASNARIALTCILISAVFLFNNTSHPDRGSLQFLRYLETVRQRIPASPDLPRNFPSFLWVFRDFFLQLPTRKDTGTPYTLQEYMLERVLQNEQQGIARRDQVEGAVVDSLLHDFTSFGVLSVGYPKRQAPSEGMPAIQFSPEEMSQLDDIPWDQFDASFRHDIERVIAYSLHHATPFQLGNKKDKESKFSPIRKRWTLLPRKTKDEGIYATGNIYAKWCTTVLELVNADSVIPNIYDIQHQLLQSMADEKLEEAIQTYQKELQAYMDICPVFNDTEKIKELPGKFSALVKSKSFVDVTELVKDKNLKGIAVPFSLTSKSDKIIEKLREDLKQSISSVPILADALRKLDSKCIDIEDKASVLSIAIEANAQRSKAACEALAEGIYMPVRKVVREDPTATTVEEFQEVLTKIETSFRQQARGSAVPEVTRDYFEELGESDKIFVAKVNEKNQLVEEKAQMVSTLEKNLTEVQQKNKEEIDRLNREYEESLAKALAEQTRLKALEAEMTAKLAAAEQKLIEDEKKKLEEIEKLKADAEVRLANEVKAREERIEQEQAAYQEEIEKLKLSADEKMEAQILAAQEHLKTEQQRIEEETQRKLDEAEKKLQEEVHKRESELEEVRKAHEEVKREKELLEEKKNQLCSICCCL
jgi:hypothetical protein